MSYIGLWDRMKPFSELLGKTLVSRILLEIVSVRVERLNDCSEADAVQEGLPWHHCTDWMGPNGAQRNFGPVDAFKSWLSGLVCGKP